MVFLVDGGWLGVFGGFFSIFFPEICVAFDEYIYIPVLRSNIPLGS